MMTRQQQRDRDSARMMLSIQLEAHLRNLVSEVKGGNLTKLIEFQQAAQYAPSEMKDRILSLCDAQ